MIKTTIELNDDVLEKKIVELENYCLEKNIPMICSVLANAEQNKYRTVMVSPTCAGVIPNGRDMITDCLKVFRGYVPIQSEIEAKVKENLMDNDDFIMNDLLEL